MKNFSFFLRNFCKKSLFFGIIYIEKKYFPTMQKVSGIWSGNLKDGEHRSIKFSRPDTQFPVFSRENLGESLSKSRCFPDQTAISRILVGKYKGEVTQKYQVFPTKPHIPSIWSGNKSKRSPKMTSFYRLNHTI